MKISIIVPVYNVENYIERCIKSIISQTYKDLEIILINDGAKDNSPAICERYASIDSRIMFINKENGGVSSARNKGIELSTGELITFVDGDDWIKEDMYEHMYQILIENDADVASVRWKVVTEVTPLKNSEIKIECLEGNAILKYYFKEESYSVWNKLYRRGVLNKQRFALDLKVNEDVYFNYQVLSSIRKLVKSNQVKYFYFYNKDSVTKQGLNKNDFDTIKVSNKMLELAKHKKSKEVIELIQVKMARDYFSILAKILYFGIKDCEINYKNIVNNCLIKLRDEYFLLMLSSIPLSRKFLITLMCINFKVAKHVVEIYKFVFKIKR